MPDARLGRRPPTDWVHVERWNLRTVQPETVTTVERVLPINYAYRSRYDQGQEGACVGYACSWMQSFLNRRFFDAHWLYTQAQAADEFWDTPPEEGTSVRAGCDVLRELGHRRILRGKTLPVDVAEGLAANRWATTVDEIRTAIAGGIPVTLGVNWYSDGDVPSQGKGYDHWIARYGITGRLRGGHAICCYGASDRRQAVKLCNSWGSSYPLVWLPYPVLQRLLDEDGEATLVVDR